MLERLLTRCSLPITGLGCVKKVVTELGVFEIVPEGFQLLERAPGISVEYIREKTEGHLLVIGETPEMILD